MMMKPLFILLLSLLFIARISGQYHLTLINNVAPCSNGNYADTIKLFYLGGGQQDVPRGSSVSIQSGQIDPNNGLGIQENGEYCRSHGNEAGCDNPDNAGMELKLNGGSCTNIQVNPPFYCGKYPPNAENIVDVSMSGGWPNCVATLTRKAGAPSCQFSC